MSERMDFLRSAASSDTDACIEWPYTTDGKGYGRIQIDGERHRVTHLTLALSGSPRPNDAFALHSCDNPPCCNPRHLRWGTQAENMADRMERGRFALGSKHHRAQFTEADIREMRRQHVAGVSEAVIARTFGTSRQNVHQIVRRRTWGHVA